MDTLSKSQVRKQKKIAKRKERKARNIAKNLKAQEGKFIEENHNGGLYGPDFTILARDTWMERILEAFKNSGEEEFYRFLRDSRQDLQTLILKWSDSVERDQAFWFILGLLDTYRETKSDGVGRESLVWKYVEKQMKIWYENN